MGDSLGWRVQLGSEFSKACIQRQTGVGDKSEVGEPRRKPQRSSKLETWTNSSKRESPALMRSRTGWREDTGFLAWLTGRSGCFLCNETGPKASEARNPPDPPCKLSKWAACFSDSSSHSLRSARLPGPHGGSDGLLARFRDGSARGHASKRAGTQEGRQPGSTPGTRGSLPAWKAPHAHARGQAASLPVKMVPRGGWLQSGSSPTGWQSRAGQASVGRATVNGPWLPSAEITNPD